MADRTAVTPDELRGRLAEGYSKYIERSWTSEPSPVPRASSIGGKCQVKLVLDIRAPETAKAPPLFRRGIFWTGKMTEFDIVGALEQASKRGGYEISSGQEGLALARELPEIKIRSVILTGHLDSRAVVGKGEVLLTDDGVPFERGLPLEYKTMQGDVFERVEDGDLGSLLSVYKWADKWSLQAQSYLLMTGAPAAILFVVSKHHRLAKTFVIEANLEEQAWIEKRALDTFLLSQLPLDEVLTAAKFIKGECDECDYYKGRCPVAKPDPVIEIGKPEVLARALELVDQRDRIAPEQARLKKLYDNLSSELKAIVEGLPLVKLSDGTIITGQEVTVGPSEGYTYWRFQAKRPKKKAPAALPPPAEAIEVAVERPPNQNVELVGVEEPKP